MTFPGRAGNEYLVWELPQDALGVKTWWGGPLQDALGMKIWWGNRCMTARLGEGS